MTVQAEPSRPRDGDAYYDKDRDVFRKFEDGGWIDYAATGWSEADRLRAVLAREAEAWSTHVDRVSEDRLRARENIAFERRLRVAQANTIATVAGGTVEGAPTHGGNYLQRIRELRRIEKGRAELLAALWCIYESDETTARVQNLCNEAIKASEGGG